MDSTESLHFPLSLHIFSLSAFPPPLIPSAPSGVHSGLSLLGDSQMVWAWLEQGGQAGGPAHGHTAHTRGRQVIHSAKSVRLCKRLFVE